MVRNLPGNAGDIRDEGSIPGLGRSPGGGHGNPLQYSCLENPMDRGAWPTFLASLVNSQGHEFEQTPGDSEELGGLVHCSPWDHRVGHDLVTEQQLDRWSTRENLKARV